MKTELGTMETRSLRARILIIALVFFGVAIIYLPGKPLISDSRWSILTTLSIIREHNTDLNEYQILLRDNKYHDTQTIGDKVYSLSPAAVALTAVPFVLIYNQVTDVRAITARDIPTGIEHVVAIFYVALAAVFIYLIAQRLIGKEAYALLAVFVFAFCTSAWSTASLALFMHGPSILMLSIALYLLLRADDRPALAQFVALPLAFSYVLRPTNAIPLALLSIYVAMQYRKFMLRYLLWGLLIAVPFIAYNFKVYGSPLSTYYHESEFFSTSHLLEGLAGTLVSPARGLLIYSPILLFSFVGFYLKIRDKSFGRLDYFLAAVIVFHWLTISSFNPWWGGHSYGPRYFTDMIPFFIYFMCPAII